MVGVIPGVGCSRGWSSRGWTVVVIGVVVVGLVVDGVVVVGVVVVEVVVVGVVVVGVVVEIPVWRESKMSTHMTTAGCNYSRIEPKCPCLQCNCT